MVDLPSVSVKGAIVFARARVLWKDGLLRMFTKEGKVWESISERPTVTLSYWSRQWKAETMRGDILMKTKCSTCGGWRKVTRLSADELWDAGQG